MRVIALALGFLPILVFFLLLREISAENRQFSWADITAAPGKISKSQKHVVRADLDGYGREVPSDYGYPPPYGPISSESSYYGPPEETSSALSTDPDSGSGSGSDSSSESNSSATATDTPSGTESDDSTARATDSAVTSATGSAELSDRITSTLTDTATYKSTDPFSSGGSATASSTSTLMNHTSSPSLTSESGGSIATTANATPSNTTPGKISQSKPATDSENNSATVVLSTSSEPSSSTSGDEPTGTRTGAYSKGSSMPPDKSQSGGSSQSGKGSSEQMTPSLTATATQESSDPGTLTSMGNSTMTASEDGTGTQTTATPHFTSDNLPVETSRSKTTITWTTLGKTIHSTVTQDISRSSYDGLSTISMGNNQTESGRSETATGTEASKTGSGSPTVPVSSPVSTGNESDSNSGFPGPSTSHLAPANNTTSHGAVASSSPVTGTDMSDTSGWTLPTTGSGNSASTSQGGSLSTSGISTSTLTLSSTVDPVPTASKNQTLTTNLMSPSSGNLESATSEPTAPLSSGSSSSNSSRSSGHLSKTGSASNPSTDMTRTASTTPFGSFTSSSYDPGNSTATNGKVQTTLVSSMDQSAFSSSTTANMSTLESDVPTGVFNTSVGPGWVPFTTTMTFNGTTVTSTLLRSVSAAVTAQPITSSDFSSGASPTTMVNGTMTSGASATNASSLATSPTGSQDSILSSVDFGTRTAQTPSQTSFLGTATKTGPSQSLSGSASRTRARTSGPSSTSKPSTVSISMPFPSNNTTEMSDTMKLSTEYSVTASLSTLWPPASRNQTSSSMLTMSANLTVTIPTAKTQVSLSSTGSSKDGISAGTTSPSNGVPSPSGSNLTTNPALSSTPTLISEDMTTKTVTIGSSRSGASGTLTNTLISSHNSVTVPTVGLTFTPSTNTSIPSQTTTRATAPVSGTKPPFPTNQNGTVSISGTVISSGSNAGATDARAGASTRSVSLTVTGSTMTLTESSGFNSSIKGTMAFGSTNTEKGSSNTAASSLSATTGSQDSPFPTSRNSTTDTSASGLISFSRTSNNTPSASASASNLNTKTPHLSGSRSPSNSTSRTTALSNASQAGSTALSTGIITDFPTKTAAEITTTTVETGFSNRPTGTGIGTSGSTRNSQMTTTADSSMEESSNGTPLSTVSNNWTNSSYDPTKIWSTSASGSAKLPGTLSEPTRTGDMSSGAESATAQPISSTGFTNMTTTTMSGPMSTMTISGMNLTSSAGDNLTKEASNSGSSLSFTTTGSSTCTDSVTGVVTRTGTFTRTWTTKIVTPCCISSNVTAMSHDSTCTTLSAWRNGTLTSTELGDSGRTTEKTITTSTGSLDSVSSSKLNYPIPTEMTVVNEPEKPVDELPDDPNFPWGGGDSPIHRHQPVEPPGSSVTGSKQTKGGGHKRSAAERVESLILDYFPSKKEQKKAVK